MIKLDLDKTSAILSDFSISSIEHFILEANPALSKARFFAVVPEEVGPLLFGLIQAGAANFVVEVLPEGDTTEALLGTSDSLERHA